LEDVEKYLLTWTEEGSNEEFLIKASQKKNFFSPLRFVRSKLEVLPGYLQRKNALIGLKEMMQIPQVHQKTVSLYAMGQRTNITCPN